jgi:CheY-like chemotaxis protein
MSTGARVLVVDDEQVVLDSVRKHLKNEGYELQTVLSGADALSVLESGWPEIVITDLMMPGMDGLELLERIEGTQQGIPVIMITGYATMRTALQALRKGAFDYIAKPFTRAELQGVVSRAACQISLVADPEQKTRTRQEAVRPETPLQVGGHCWVDVEPSGTARIGLERAFAVTIGEVTSVELPDVGDCLEQGSLCLRFLTADGCSHTLWSPLSGRILELNETLRESPKIAVEDPYGAGWLLRLDPGNLEEELKGLSLK